MHFILFLALVPSLCVFSLEIPSQPESPVGGPFRNQQFLTGFDNAQQQLSTANANNEINSESPGLSAQLMDDKKSTSSVTRQQFRVCSSMTILPLHDYGSCSRTIHRLAGAVCRGAGNGNGGNLGVNSLGFGGRKRRSSSTGSAGGDEFTNEEELEDALLEFTNGNRNRNHPQNGFWAQGELFLYLLKNVLLLKPQKSHFFILNHLLFFRAKTAKTLLWKSAAAAAAATSISANSAAAAGNVRRAPRWPDFSGSS